IHLRRHSGDFDRLVCGTDGKLQVCSVLLVDFKLDPLDYPGPKPSSLDMNRVVLSHRNGQKLVAARTVGLDLAFQSSSLISHGAGCIRKGGTTGIGDGTKNSASNFCSQKLATEDYDRTNKDQTFVEPVAHKAPPC